MVRRRRSRRCRHHVRPRIWRPIRPLRDSEGDRPLQVRGGRGVVDDQGEVMPFGLFGHSGHLGDIEIGVGKRFYEDGPGGGADPRRKMGDVV